LLCWESGGHPEDDLARFGYMLDMKSTKKKTESFYILGYLLELVIKNMAIWKNKFEI
jgi:hypothetical protein